MKIFNRVSGIVIIVGTIILMNVRYDIALVAQGVIVAASMIVWAFVFCFMYPVLAKVRKGHWSNIGQETLDKFVLVYNSLGIFILLLFLVTPEASARSADWLVLPGLSLYYFLCPTRCVAPASDSS